MSMDDLQQRWLWAEIARRFGRDEANELKRSFELAFNRTPSEHVEELLQLEERLRQLEQAGEPETAYMRSLRWGIEYRRQIIRDEL